MFVYLGPSPNFTGCTANTWTSSGNLVGTSDACRVDTSQHAPGTQCSTWEAALALLGACVSARDGVAATKADKANSGGKGQGKKRR